LIARNGLAEDLANSFLIVCRTSDAGSRAPAAGDKAIAWHYSVDRHPAFAKQAVFQRRASGDLVVRRSRLSDAAAPDVPLRLMLDDEDFLPGRIWSVELNRLMNRPGWTSQEVADWLRVWIDAVLARAECAPSADLQTIGMLGIFLDAMPFNMVREPTGATRFFDLEWESQAPLTMHQLAYRAMSKSLTRMTSCAAPADRRNLAIAFLIRDVLRRVGINIKLRSMFDLEWDDRKLQHMVRFGSVGGPKPNVARVYLRTLKVRSAGRDGLAGRMMRMARGVRSA